MAPAGGYCYSGDVGGEEVGGVAPKKHSGGEEGKIKGGGRESRVTVRSLRSHGVAFLVKTLVHQTNQ